MIAALRTPLARRVLILLAVLALLVGAYALAGFLAVPYLLRSGMTSYTQQHYGRRISLGEIRFNPFRLQLDLRDVSFPGASGAPMLGVAHVGIGLKLASVWKRGPAFSEILLERPFVNARVLPNGTLNLSELSRPFASTPAARTQPSSPLRLFIDRLTVRDGATSFEDLSHATPFRTELKPINFQLLNFNTIGTGADTYRLDFATTLGERFHWDGAVGLTPIGSHGSFRIDALHARTLWSYLPDVLPLEITSGLIGLEGDYRFAVREPSPELVLNVRTLNLDDLALGPRGASESDDPIHIAHLEVQGTHIDLAHRSVAIDGVHLKGGGVRAWLNEDGTTNLQQLLPAGSAAGAPPPPPGPQTQITAAKSPAPAPAAAAAGAPAAGAAAASWSLAVPDITVGDFGLSAEDRSVTPSTRLDLTNVNLQVKGFRTPHPQPLELLADARVNDSAHLHASGTVDMTSNAARMDVDLKDFDLTVLQPYVAARSAITLTSGRVSAKLAVERTAQGVTTVSGGTEVTRLRTVDNALKQDLIKWDRLTLKNLRYRSEPARLSIAEIDARGPYARLIIASDRSVNIAEALHPAGPVAAPAAANPPSHPPAHASPASAQGPSSATASLPLSIGIVRVDNGSARYADQWIQPHFAVGIEQLSGTVQGLSSDPSSRATIDLNGKVDRYAPVKISGTVNLLSASLYTDIKMSFRGLELTSITPYSGHFAGYKIEKGKASVDLAYHVENRQLKADQRFVIDQLQLGEKVQSPDAVKLPLKLAVALLKDRNGVIDLGLPVTGSLDDPKFRLGPIIWKAFIGLLTKIATAPFAALGKLFGGGEQVNIINFDAGSAELDPAAKERLASIAHSLTERPQLELDVPAAYSPKADGPALSRMQLQEKLLDRKRAELAAAKHPADQVDPSVLSDPAEHLRLLVAVYRDELGASTALPASAQAVVGTKHHKSDPPPDLESAIKELDDTLQGRVSVADSDLQALGHRRARAVQNVLLGDGKLDPARVFVINAPPHDSADARVPLELSLK